MALCCPPGHGCNAPGGGEPCALALCRAAAKEEEDAAVALARWDALEAVAEGDSGDGKRRFRRRAFERARDKALIALAMTRDRQDQPRWRLRSFLDPVSEPLDEVELVRLADQVDAEAVMRLLGDEPEPALEIQVTG